MSHVIVSFFFRIRSISLLLVAATALLTSEVQAADPTNSTPASDTESLRALLYLQEQLRSTQQAIERNRREAETANTRNAESLQSRLASIESVIAVQRAKEMEAMREANRTVIFAVGTFAAIALVVMVLTAYLQWRSIQRLAELATMRATTSTGLPAVSAATLLDSPAAAQASSQLLGALDLLEKRIHQLEATTQTPTLAGTTAENIANGHTPKELQTDQVSLLLAKGESLLGSEQSEEALACFNSVLEVSPEHAEALVKKGVALERLRKLDEALACYDRAIQADRSLTMAYLQKGGLCNRLERYEEALKCYEQALHTQEKSHAA